MEDAYAYFFHCPHKFARPIIEKSESKIRQQDHNDLVVFQRISTCIVLLLIVLPCVELPGIVRRSVLVSSPGVLHKAITPRAKDTGR
jgi:hypothetical protein